jgi:ANTAR domain/GAF domain
MPHEIRSGPERRAREVALEVVANAAAGNIAGVDFVSITLHRHDHSMSTVAATDPLAWQADSLQYELREGPCYAAVTDERFVLVNDLSAAREFPRYAPRAVALGLGAQAAVQLLHNGERAGLNMYARRAGALDRSTVQLAELFAAQAGALLGYAEQAENLTQALHTRSDIATAIGILMERYSIDHARAFAFLTRNSQHRNVKVRVLAQEIIDGTFQSTPNQDRDAQDWP